MTNHPKAIWSDSLQQETRSAIEQMPITLGRNLNFMQSTQGYAYATVDDICQDLLIMNDQSSHAEQQFDNVKALLDAGWAVD